MNDEELVSNSTDEAPAPTCNPSQTPTEETTPSNGTDTDSSCSEEPLEMDPAISEDPVSHSDPDPLPSSAPNPQDELGVLRNELKQLRDEIASRDAFFERIGKDCEEFFAIYPDKSLASLPDGVWDDVRKGVPIAAATALYERKQRLKEECASDSNLNNKRRSSGSLEPTPPDYFSPAEVRAMSASEVRTNYQKIMRSMKAWH